MSPVVSRQVEFSFLRVTFCLPKGIQHWDNTKLNQCYISCRRGKLEVQGAEEEGRKHGQ